KLAAISVFCDGIGAIIDGLVAKFGGGGMRMFADWGAISFPIALAMYWGLLIYLFSMDSEDSWTVVVLLAAFDWIVKIALSMLLMAAVMGWVGIPSGALSLPSIGSGGKPMSSDPDSVLVAELKEKGNLWEARDFIKGGRQAVFATFVEDWYAAGCTRVWFSV